MTAVEFALIAPILFVMLLGTIELTQLFHTRATVQYAVERAGRAVSLDGSIDAAEFEKLVRAEMANLQDLEMKISLDIDSSGPIAIAHVHTDFAYEVQVPFLDSFSLNFAVDSYLPQNPA